MPHVLRRTAISAGAVVAVGLSGAGSAAARTAEPGGGAAGPRRSDFADSVGTVFTLTARGRRTRARLISVDTPAAGAARPDLCFTLVFAPLSGRVLPDRIYHVHRAGRRAQQLFLSGLGTGNRLQAVIDRRTG